MVMDRSFETRPGAVRDEPSGPSLLAEVLAHWPTAPVSEVSATGRWLKLERPGGVTVYLERYAWDEPCQPQYLVVLPASPDRAEQRRCPTLAEAIETAKRLLLSRPAPRKVGLLEALEELTSGGRSLAATLPA
jgi:hypothetical protein